MSKTTVRSVLALLVVVALVISACSSGSRPSAPSSSAGSGSGFPATVATKFGTVTIPKRPTRVVALGWGDAETALQLGVQPVGASDWLAFGGSGVGPWAASLYRTPPKIIGTLEPDYEQIAGLRPDLILDTKSSGDEKRHELLSKIAPTVGVPSTGDNYLTTTTQQVTMIATALGEPDKGRSILHDVDADFAKAAAAHPGFTGRTVTVAAYDSEGWGAYIQGETRVEFLEKLGFTLNPTIARQKTKQFSVPISSERLSELEADVLVTFPIQVPASQVTDQKLYQNLTVVRDKHAIVISNKVVGSAFSLGTPLALEYAIAHVVPLLVQATGS